jgi:hypothetical protein
MTEENYWRKKYRPSRCGPVFTIIPWQGGQLPSPTGRLPPGSPALPSVRTSLQGSRGSRAGLSGTRWRNEEYGSSPASPRNIDHG